MLQSFQASWVRERPTTAQRAVQQRTDMQMTPFGWLAQEAGVKKRTLERIASGARPRSRLDIADKIVQALAGPQLYQDGTLNVVRLKGGAYVSVDGDEPNSLTG